ncbi:MAG: LCP family protein [Selenomonadales bacterium]|jgi:LCP family protein required for cell wall assembly|nr:LCP family protein [Selenomonadales bacterium]
MHTAMRYLVAAVFLILSVAVGSTVLVLNGLAPVPLDEGPVTLTPPWVNAKVNVLVLGTDAGLLDGGKQGALRTDTMLVVSLDPVTYEVRVLSLPRDSRVSIPGRRHPDKINAAHAYGGIRLAVDTVERLLDIPLHYYVRLEHRAFRRLIDAIGGVDYYVEKNMFYEDPYQDLVINLRRGQQILDGSKAEQYVRYRGSDGDIGRIARQQRFMLAALRTMLRPANIMRINSIVDIALSSVRTNIDPQAILKHLPLLDNISPEKVTMLTLPGIDGWIGGVSYWLVEEQAMDAMLREHFWDTLTSEPSEITVRVEDASGNNLGARAAEVLTRRGFQVLDVRAASEVTEKTRITVHNGYDEMGHTVYRVLRQGNVFSERATRDVKVTIVLGQDFWR